MNSSFRLFSLLVLSCLLVAAGFLVNRAAQAAEGQGEQDEAPMLHVSVIAGELSGKNLCYVCTKAESTFGVFFIREYNGMVRDFVKQLDGELKKHEGVEGLVVLLQDRAQVEDKVKADLEDAGLQHVSFAFPDGDKGRQNVKDWQLKEGKQTNAALVVKHHIAKRLTAGCPHCEGVAAEFSKLL